MSAANRWGLSRLEGAPGLNASTIVIESFPALFFYRNSESKRASLVAQTVKNPPAMQAIWV